MFSQNSYHFINAVETDGLYDLYCMCGNFKDGVFPSVLWTSLTVFFVVFVRMDKDSSMTVDWSEFLQHVILNPVDNISELVTSWKHQLVRGNLCSVCGIKTSSQGIK